jgi:hypothetical protein
MTLPLALEDDDPIGADPPLQEEIGLILTHDAKLAGEVIVVLQENILTGFVLFVFHDYLPSTLKT